jgi:DNA-directed RNA polymerase specialized sigma54-like protein
MADEFEEAKGRHPFRFLFKFAAFAGLAYAAGRFVARKKDEYADLTESQARDRLMEKMSPKVGDDTAGEIVDQVIPKLKDRGLLKADPIEEVSDEVEKAAGEVADAAEEKVDAAADQVAEAVDSVVKD